MPQVNLAGQKMGVHDWIYDSQVTEKPARPCPTLDTVKSMKDRMLEVELGL